jgi:hypothetical protein
MGDKVSVSNLPSSLSDEEMNFKQSNADKILMRKVIETFEKLMLLFFDTKKIGAKLKYTLKLKHAAFVVKKLIKHKNISFSIQDINSDTYTGEYYKYAKTKDNIIKICDIVLSGLCIHDKHRLQNEDMYDCIEHIVSLLDDEYEILINTKDQDYQYGNIYQKNNQEIISAIKNTENDDLIEIIKMASVSGDLVDAMVKLAKFLEPHHKHLDEIIGEKSRKIFTEFANTKRIRHNNYNQTEATTQELQIFFDFGLSLARLVLLNKK